MIGIGIGVDKGKKRTGVDAVQAYLNRVIADGGENLLSKAEIEALLPPDWQNSSFLNVPSSRKAGKLYSIIGSDLTTTRASTANEFTSGDIFENKAINVPRITFAGSQTGYLSEKESTNLVTYSESFADYRSNRATKSDLGAALYSTGSMALFTATAGNAQIGRFLSVTAGVTQTWSALVDVSQGNFAQISGAGTSEVISINLTTGATVGTATITGVGRSVQIIGNYYWASITFTALTTGNHFWQVSNAAGTNTATGETVAMGYYQMEVGTSATSYNKTDAGTVTRAGELAKITDSSSNIGQTEGTIHLKAYLRVLSTDRVLKRIAVDANNYFEIVTTTNNEIRARVVSSAVTTNILTSAVFTEGLYDIKFAYKNADYALSVNGAITTSTLADVFPSGTFSDVYLGSNHVGTVNADDPISLYGLKLIRDNNLKLLNKTKELQDLIYGYFDRVNSDGGEILLTDIELEQLLPTDWENASFLNIPSARKAGKLYSIIGSDLDADRLSIANEFARDNTFQSKAIDTPRISFKGGFKGLLAEGEATNLKPRSLDWANSNFIFNNTTETQSAPRPLFNSSALMVRETATTSAHSIQIRPDATLVIGEIYTRSYLINPRGRKVINFGDSGQANNDARINVETNTVIVVGSNVISAKSTLLDSGIYEVSITFTATSITGRPNIAIFESNSVFSYLGDVTKGFDLYAIQYELGNHATSQIITDATVKTRVKEQITKTGMGAQIGQVNSTILLKFNASNLSTLRTALTIDGTTGVLKFQKLANNDIQISLVDGATTIFSIVLTGSLEGDQRIAISYKSDQYLVSRNGSTITGGSITETLPTMTRLTLGSDSNDTSHWDDTIKLVSLWNEFKNQTTLNEMTI